MKKIIKAILILAVCFCNIFFSVTVVNAEIRHHTGDSSCPYIYKGDTCYYGNVYIVTCNYCNKSLEEFNTQAEAEEAEKTLMAEHLPNCRKKPKTSTNTANSQQLTANQQTANPILNLVEKAGIFLLLIVGSAFSFVKR